MEYDKSWVNVRFAKTFGLVERTLKTLILNNYRLCSASRIKPLY
jgi:hypothetical protein